VKKKWGIKIHKETIRVAFTREANRHILRDPNTFIFKKSEL
jgi:hypothetical protein